MTAKLFTASADLLNMLLRYAAQIGIQEQTIQHAFKRWTGLTPGDYRKNIGEK